MSHPNSPAAAKKKERPRPGALIVEKSAASAAPSIRDGLLEHASKAIQDPKFLEAVNGMFEKKLVAGERVSDRGSAKRIAMAYELYQKYGDLKFESKPGGITLGFIASNAEHKLYVKDFLGRSTSGKPEIIELFAYKLLQELGFGAQVDVQNYQGILPFIASHDLEMEGVGICFGEVAKSYLAKHKKTDEVCKSKVIALEILGKILNLGDVSHNPGNYGIVIKGDEVFPILVDFHFDPILGTGMSERGSNVRLLGLTKTLETAEAASDSVAVGLTGAFVGTEIPEETYDAALEMISSEKFNAAIECSRKFCLEFLREIKDEELKGSGFDEKFLDEYAGEIRDNFAKLHDARRRSSAAVCGKGMFSISCR